MDAETVIFIIGLIIWFIFSIVGKLARSGGSPYVDTPQGGEAQQQQMPPGSRLAQELRQLAQRQGWDVPYAQEQPVATEHSLTPGEHRRTISETRATASEASLIPSEQRRTTSETVMTASEQVPVAAEHAVSPEEHVPGDAWEDRSPAPYAEKGEEAVDLGAEVVADLFRGPASLARAVVLQEILDRPLSLRSTKSGQR